jgi:hypothetical protein
MKNDEVICIANKLGAIRFGSVCIQECRFHFLPYHRAYVSLSSSFPAGVCFLGNPALKGIGWNRLAVSTTGKSLLESYPVPAIRFALREVCAIHQIWGWVKLGGQKDAKASRSYQYLLVKSLSLFDAVFGHDGW